MNELKCVQGRVVCSVNLEGKNSHTFSNGMTIRIERQVDNFNKRETQPVNGIVIDSEHIPSGAEILIGHNAIHEVNQIFDYKSLSGEEIASDTKYYSLPDSECFLWRIGNDEWKPIPPFETALRVFKPYQGLLSGVGHQKIKDVLYVTSGDLEGHVVKTLKACDYEVIFQNGDGREERIIRFRPYGDDKNSRDPEAIAILNRETKMVQQGKLFIGLTQLDCKQIKETINAD